MKAAERCYCPGEHCGSGVPRCGGRPTARRRTRESDRCTEGGSVHTWESRGLDTRDGTLVSTRACVWCDAEQTKPYGVGGRRPWRTVAP